MSIQIQGGPRRLWPWVGAGGLAVLVAGAWVGSMPGTSGSPSSVPGLSGTGERRESAPSVAFQDDSGVGGTGLEGLPASLQGSQVSGDARVDGAGRLVVDRGLRELFDYFLSTLGEESLEKIRMRLNVWLSARLSQAARAQALDLLDRYIAYQKVRGQAGPAADLPEQGLNLQHFERLQQRLATLRAQHFSAAEIEGFFGDEIVQDRYVQARWQLMNDASLSPDEKARRLHALKAGMPEAWREAESVAERHRDLSALSEEWRRRQGPPAELRQIREQLVGAEAADRLEALDQARAAWTRRVAEWQARSEAIRRDGQLSPSQRDEALLALRRQSFTDPEWLRVAAVQGVASP